MRRNLAIVLPLLVVLLFSGTREACATDYYVSSTTGVDTYSGLSPETPWKSLARVNGARLTPGDRVLLHGGESWREQLRPPSSGTPEQPIVYGSYGAGGRPVLEGQRLSALDRASKTTKGKYLPGDIAIDNNGQSHVVYDGLEIRRVLEGLRIYAWSGEVQDVTVQNCLIEVEASAPGGPPSAAVYANVRTGRIAELHILTNHLIPYPRRLEHWGIYFVAGVEHFRIDGNILGPAGEDGITVWHAAYGEISHNQGGGNGENTIDVKDSHDIVIRDNDADLDREYNIVVHGVDMRDGTYNVRVESNRCSRGGQGGELSAGIALLFAQKSGIENNRVEFAFGAGILIKDAGAKDTGAISGNWASRNRLTGNGAGQKVPAIVLQGVPTARVEDNEIAAAPGMAVPVATGAAK